MRLTVFSVPFTEQTPQNCVLDTSQKSSWFNTWVYFGVCKPVQIYLLANIVWCQKNQSQVTQRQNLQHAKTKVREKGNIGKNCKDSYRAIIFNLSNVLFGDYS